MISRQKFTGYGIFSSKWWFSQALGKFIMRRCRAVFPFPPMGSGNELQVNREVQTAIEELPGRMESQFPSERHPQQL